MFNYILCLWRIVEATVRFSYLTPYKVIGLWVEPYHGDSTAFYMVLNYFQFILIKTKITLYFLYFLYYIEFNNKY